MRTCVVIALLVACAVNVFSQQLSSQARAQAIAESFSKNKHVVKDKFGIRVEKYKDVKVSTAESSGDTSMYYTNDFLEKLEAYNKLTEEEKA